MEYLAKEDNVLVRPAVREISSKATLKSSAVVESPIVADVTDITSLTNALKGAAVVVFAASASSKGGSAQAVDYIGVENVAKVCVQLKVPRLVVISRYCMLFCLPLSTLKTSLLAVQSPSRIRLDTSSLISSAE